MFEKNPSLALRCGLVLCATALLWTPTLAAADPHAQTSSPLFGSPMFLFMAKKLSPDGALIVVALMIVVGLVAGIAEWLNQKKADKYDGNCSACASKNIAVKDGVLTCQQCGYQWGEGLAQKQQQEQQEALARMPQSERFASAYEDLVEADRYLQQAAEAIKESSSNLAAFADHASKTVAVWEQTLTESLTKALTSGQSAVQKLYDREDPELTFFRNTISELVAHPFENRAEKQLPVLVELIHSAQKSIQILRAKH